MDCQKNYLGHFGRSTSFVTVFKIILKLVEFFTSCGQSGKIVQTLRMVHKLCNFLKNYSEAFRIFNKLWAVSKKYLRHSGGSTSCGTSNRIILKLVEFFTSYGESEKMFRTLRKVQKPCNSIQKYSEAYKIFYKLWGV